MENELEIYDFFKTPNILRKETKEGLKDNRRKSLGLNLIFWLVKLSFFATITFLFLILVNLNNYNFNLILFVALFIITLIISIFTYGPLKVSQCKHSINMIENTNPKFSDILFGFKNKYFRNVAYGISLFFIYLINLVLLIFPFAIKYIQYQISGYILAENLDLKLGEALKLSKNFSKGHYKKYLKLFLSFTKEFLLCLPTLYIYSLWLRPKFNAAVYCYYRDIKK